MNSKTLASDSQKREPLTEPRFVDEETLLSARPVIPIVALEAKSRLSRRLILFMAVITSMLFGAGAAAFIIHLEGRGADARTTQVESLPVEAHESSTSLNKADNAESGGGKSLSIDSSVAAAASLSVAGAATDAPRIGRKQVGLVNSRNLQPTTHKSSAVKPVSQEARQTEGRARRVWDTEHVFRSNKGRSPNDLFRIEEIFVGPSKP